MPNCIRLIVLCLLMSCTASLVNGQEDNTDANAEDSTEQTQQEDEEQQAAAEQHGEEDVFDATEQISEDKSVPFPVDI